MLGRTNLTASGAGGVTTVDLPTPLASIAARAGQKTAYIDLTYSSTALLSGVELRYKEGAYPSSPSDGTGITTAGAPATITVPDLEVGKTYYFRAYPYREIGGIKYYQTSTENAMASVPIIAVSVNGVTIARQGSNYLLIDKSATFTLTGYTPVTIYVTGGGGKGSDGYVEVDSETDDTSYGAGSGGYGGKYSINNFTLNGTYNCTTSIGNATTDLRGSNSSLKIGSTTYTGTEQKTGGRTNADSSGGKGADGINTPYGYIGSSGGSGAENISRNYVYYGGEGGVGAGDGGDALTRSCTAGTDANNYGCGGGGGAARINNDDYSSGGSGKQGCVIIAW